MKVKFSFKNIILFSVLVAASLLVLFPVSSHPASFSYSAAIILVTLACWSTSIIPPFLAGLIFFALSAIFHLADNSILLSGFASSAVWLIIAGFVIGSAIASTGLDKRLAAVIAPYLVFSYSRLIFGLVATAMLLGFIMPSSVGRAIVLIPIGMALAEKVGFVQGSNGRRGIAVALALACNIPSFAILPANIPNMILTGASETLFGIHFSYIDYVLLHYPVLGILKSLLLVILVLVIFPDKVVNEWDMKKVKSAPEANADQKKQNKVAWLLGITLLFWITDSIHGVNAAWVGLTTAIILLLPKWGVVETKSFNSIVDFGTVIFVAAALGLGALVNASGVGESMGQAFSYLLPTSTENTFLSFMSLSLISTLTGLVTTVPGVPTVLSPMAADFAQLTGFSVTTVLMTQVIGFSTILFPYQVAPLIIAMQLSRESLASLLKVTLPLAIVTILFLMPLDYLWWATLGWIK
ncbi:SLC13 family permease [Psychromonas algicola]|uniref:SLC13 family permease n=1 Tax=Psychromonas algicola TaxID=2555642 RepID=UPI0010672697|nr:SLC13 family permease [Psychromonas sp. RZ5]TEW45336.1 SLC13 family permease [Psychromonas sp. RZ5]